MTPTWSSSAKDSVGTLPGSSSIWFTIGHGILNEVYWPRVDRPQIRDLGFIVADDASFWSEVKRNQDYLIRYERPGILVVSVEHRHPRYVLRLRICPHDVGAVVRIEASLEDRRTEDDLDRAHHPLRLYSLLAPHLGFSGHANRAWVGTYKGRPMLFAQHESAALALASDPAPARRSVGYVGTSDGWQDFTANGRMTWSHEQTGAGNVAAMSEVIPDAGAVQFALGFGERSEEAGLEAAAALLTPFETAWHACVTAWDAVIRAGHPAPGELQPSEQALYVTSVSVLRTHQDGMEPGGAVASLSIPWGNTTNDRGGYHLVWSRDLVEIAGAFVALGVSSSARQTLAYLIATQEPDGSWPQNQWLDGVPYWPGVQLDEAAYPILLVGALRSGTATLRPEADGATKAVEVLRENAAHERKKG